MMRMPLSSTGIKIGQIGRIDWFKTGRIVQFIDSNIMDEGMEHRGQIYSELMRMRDSINMAGYSKKIIWVKILIIMLIFAFFYYEIRFVLNPILPPITLMIIFLIVYICTPVEVVFFIRYALFRKVKNAIQQVNKNLRNEGVNIYLVLKESNWWKRICSKPWELFNFVEVFHYNTLEMSHFDQIIT